MSAGEPIARIAELWRYPVKSMRGERVEALELLRDGVAHDRRYAIESSGAPRGKPLLTGAERAAMLLYAASVCGGGVRVRMPGGEEFGIGDPALLRSMEASLPQGNGLRVVHSERPLTDVRPVAVLSRETVGQLGRELGQAVDGRRFRANVVLSFEREDAGFAEDALVGRTLRLGAAAMLRVTERDPRCRVVILDPETAVPDAGLMKHLDRRHEGRLGVYAVVAVPGPLRVGDAVWVA